MEGMSTGGAGSHYGIAMGTRAAPGRRLAVETLAVFVTRDRGRDGASGPTEAPPICRMGAA